VQIAWNVVKIRGRDTRGGRGTTDNPLPYGELLRQFRNQNPPRAAVLIRKVIRKPIPTSTNGKPTTNARMTAMALPMYFFPQRGHLADSKVSPFPQSKHIITLFSPFPRGRLPQWVGTSQFNTLSFRAISVAR
jgi:hypothetical protein